MLTCEICGTEFDELGVQIVVPGIAKSFDRIDCAVRGRALHGARTTPPFAPARGTFVEIPRGRERRSYDLLGLPAGLTAALSGMRARMAVGGASAAVVLLVAATAHLSLRSGGAAEVARMPVLPPPLPYGDDDRPTAGPVETSTAPDAATAVETVATPESPPALAVAEPGQGSASPPADGQDADDRSHRLVVYRAQATAYLLTVTRTRAHVATKKAHVAAKKAKPARAARTRHAAKTSRRSAAKTTVSTRPGWGRGDKNHAHTGPPQHSASAYGKAHGRRR